MELPQKQTRIQLKQGDTFSLGCVARMDGVIMNLTNVTIKSQLWYKGTLIAECTVIRINDLQGEFQLRIENTETVKFPIGTLLSDIEYTINGQVVSTTTFSVVCLPDETGRYQ
jgi:hypothetical protein